MGESGRIHVVSVGLSACDAAHHAELARRFLKYHKIEAVPLALESSAEPANVILEQVRRLGAGLLVMGAYGQPVLGEFFVGSATRTLLNGVPVPIFCYH